MKFAFLIMGKFNSETDKAAIHNGVSQLIGVADIEDACRTARNLYENGIDCIELCGAFGAEGARKIIEATENKIPAGSGGGVPGCVSAKIKLMYWEQRAGEICGPMPNKKRSFCKSGREIHFAEAPFLKPISGIY